MLKVFEAFAGYGSQSIALRNLGIDYEVVAISEIDADALIAYGSVNDMEVDNNVDIESAKIELMNSNVGFDFKTQKSSIPRMKTDKLVKLYTAHKVNNNLGDISKIKVEDIPDHDLFTYSFPCQDISVAGKQEGIVKGETRSGLLYECEKVIETKKPKYLLLENVKNLVGKKHKPHFDKWLEYLESLGYTNYWKVLNAKDYGVPQNRERVFVVSILGEHKPYEFPSGFKLTKAIKDILENEVDKKYYMNKPFKLVNNSYAPCVNTCQGGNLEPKILQVANTYDSYEQNSRIYGVEGIAPTLAARDYKDAKKILIPQATKKGYIEMGIPGVCDLSYPNSKTRRGRVQEDGKVSPTLTASQQDICYIDKVERAPLKFLNRNGKQTGEDYCFCVDTTNTGGIKETYNTGDFRVRKLTPRECFRLMGLNDNDIDKIQAEGISNSQQYKMAGNSIVIDVLEGIFRELFLSNNNQYNAEKVTLGKEEVEQLSFVI